MSQELNPKLQALLMALVTEGRCGVNEAREIFAEAVEARCVPEGFVQVPVQATQEMYAAWMCSEGGWADRYKAMLAARPEVA